MVITLSRSSTGFGKSRLPLLAVSALVRQYVRSVSPTTYYGWRHEYGGLNLDQARCLKKHGQENPRLKRTIADPALGKQILKEAAEGNF